MHSPNNTTNLPKVLTPAEVALVSGGVKVIPFILLGLCQMIESIIHDKQRRERAYDN